MRHSDIRPRRSIVRRMSESSSAQQPQVLHLRVISGQQLPRPRGSTARAGDCSSADPFVVVEVFGVPVDCAEERTKTVKNDSRFDWLINQSIKCNFRHLADMGRIISISNYFAWSGASSINDTRWWIYWGRFHWTVYDTIWMSPSWLSTCSFAQ